MIQSVLDSANIAIDEEHLRSAMEDLAQRVDDWKSLKVEAFGKLLRFGTFTVLKGDSNKDAEREVSLWKSAVVALLMEISFIFTCSNASFFAAKTLIPTSKRPN